MKNFMDMEQKQGNIFDLEQSIMQCWNVVDDIKLISQQVYDRPQPLTEDEMGNLLIGLETLYQMKFEKCFAEFEAICRDYHKYRKTYEFVQSAKDDGK
jgi:hypothetical protein